MKRRISVMGGLLRHQTSFLNGRLLGFTGARFDSIRYRHRDFLTAASSFAPFVPGYQVGDQISAVPQRECTRKRLPLGRQDQAGSLSPTAIGDFRFVGGF
jgi:hypothetical protein